MSTGILSHQISLYQGLYFYICSNLISPTNSLFLIRRLYILPYFHGLYIISFPCLASNVLGTGEFFCEVKQLEPKTEDLFVSICAS